MRINGCIFDLDGVIVDTAHFHFSGVAATSPGTGFGLEPGTKSGLERC